jgi:hypothetical protein
VAWSKHRKAIEEVHATARRDAILSGKATLYGLMAPLSAAPPDDWHPDRRDGHITYTVVDPDSGRNQDGTRTISVDYDLLSGRRPGASVEPTPEQVFSGSKR